MKYLTIVFFLLIKLLNYADAQNLIQTIDTNEYPENMQLPIRLLQEKDREIEGLKTGISKYKQQVLSLKRQQGVQESQLANSIQNWKSGSLELSAKESEIERLQNQLYSQVKENENLSSQFISLKSAMEEQVADLNALIAHEKEYSNKLRSELEDKGKQDVFDNAVFDAKDAFIYKPKKKTRNRIKSMLFVEFGTTYSWKVIDSFDNEVENKHGFKLLITQGWVVNRGENIYLGVGGGYQNYIQDSLAILPVFFSTKISLDGDFSYKGEDSFSAYSIIDIGLSRSLTQNKEAGYFSNIGLGYYGHIGHKLNANISLSWRRQQLVIDENKSFLNTAEISIGLNINLN